MEKQDQHHGQGGSYVVDPETGERTLVERTRDPKQPETKPADVMPSGAKRKKE